MSVWPGIALKMATDPARPMDRIEKLETALDIQWAAVDAFNVEPPRRLTGPSLLSDHPGAVMDVVFDGVDPGIVTALWEKHARKVLDHVGWGDQKLISRVFQGGVSLAISAPVDQLYSATFVAKTAWHFCAAELSNSASLSFEDMTNDLKRVMAEEANPALAALMSAAAAHDVDFLCDDDHVSVGHGIGSQIWPVDGLPAPDQVDWSAVSDGPVALLTGTNGKTTTTRLCAAIATAAGKVVGLTSTDLVQVGSDILDRGDYSGPGGGRMALRDPRVEMAFLEVARGGILRRGLPIRRARVALVTNVAKDHLGEFGVMTLDDLAQTKFAVMRALATDGALVLNADDPQIVAAAAELSQLIWWFSLDATSPQITQARERGTPCCFVKLDHFIFFDGSTEVFSMPLAEVPITLHGAAKHNVRNVLAAVCVCTVLGIAAEAIRTGLSGFASDHKDNPGRFNEFRYNGARVFVDFAHNAHSISAVCEALSAIPSKRRFIMLSQPGDHSDQDLVDVTKAALQFRPDVIVTAEIEDYLRGRSFGETTGRLQASAIADGFDPDQILSADTPPIGAKLILDNLQPGDLALMLVLSDRDEVFDLFQNSLGSK
ncbi:Mur ligase family, glutamate ligase domain [Sulfitobacter brevis]|uniref:Mur ligase family, glutamate ligase domain n=2 Tax=Sulfitobacter brevis TaxID=74348 RepID=A0A1I1XJ88_9RHOB|nr:Mur ligase family, glutamate ligase domain [Sulfitobacter brevis]